MPDEAVKQAQEQELVTSDKPITPNIDQVQTLVNALVDQYQTVGHEISTHPLNVVLQGPEVTGRDLGLYESWLAEAHDHFRKTSDRNLTLSYASEWILDNYYIIRQAIQQIKKNLPPRFFKQLPKLAQGELKGLPRIYAIARSVLAYQRYSLNPIDLADILIQLQDHFALTMGELWALPVFLRYNSIETLAYELEKVIQPQHPPHLPIPLPQLAEITGNNKTELAAIEDRTVGNLILSLRTISEQNWNDFFESVSRLEKMLREDPSGIYPLMDFETRDLYRKRIERLAFASRREEIELAEILLSLARKNSSVAPGPVEFHADLKQADHTAQDSGSHIGEYLIGRSRAEFEAQIGYHPNIITMLQRWGFRHATILYLGSIFVLALLTFWLTAFAINLPALFETATTLQRVIVFIIGLALLPPVLTCTASLTNWALTLNIPPSTLPKLRFKDEIPAPFQTLVVIPALLTDREEVDNLARQLEMHYLRNPERGLFFALLTDFRDADQETSSDDNDLLQHAVAEIESLNAKYKRPSPGDADTSSHPFYLLHRKRLWNPSEGKWMGWERKRGKLHELNRLLRGYTDLSFTKATREMERLDDLQYVRFVITLDADTVLPRGAARRLAGTLAHPLNQARFDSRTEKVISGYTVLQPRMEIHPRSTNYSWFTRIFAGDTGLDLYTRAVSDAYQDLFGEGSYVGKGIYDVDSFERSVDQHIPENSVLSHDLLEGVMGRAGLVTDITMIEDYPPSYFVQMMRQRRWIRGDWQLLPWILHPGKFRIEFSAIDRWKMIDNLLRSLLAPSLVLIFSAGMLFLPNLAGAWLAIVLVALGIPLLTSMVRSALQTLGGENLAAAFSPLSANLLRWLLAVIFLPYEAYANLDAIFTTLYRLAISHRYLLQWTTAAQSKKLFRLQAYRNAAWLKMSISALFSLSLALVIQIVHHFNGAGLAPALAFASSILLLWVFSPLIAQWISQPIKVKAVPLNDEQENILRQVIRRTWGFFERFVGPEDHWLPPDHFQEYPVGIIAHHTSPSNIGLLLTSTLAAYDFGYLDQLGLATRLSTTMDSLGQLERFRGHFLNWYETLTLQPLKPRYISTVDSGNLAASFIIAAQACKTIPGDPVFRWDLWQGYLDTLANLSETLSSMRKTEFDAQVEEINQQISGIRSKVLEVRSEPGQWYALFQITSGSFWQDLSNRLVKLVEVGRSAFDLENLRKLQEVAAQVERLHLAVQRTITDLVPWIPLLDKPPILFFGNKFLPAFKTLQASLPFNPLLNQIHTHSTKGLANIATLRGVLALGQTAPFPDTAPEHGAIEWLDALEHALTQASQNAAALIESFAQIASRAEQYVNEMDFQFLYHQQRRVFHLGFNLDAGQLDTNFYDLLASEARIASIIALAKGEAPQSHWLQLSRPLTRVEGMYVLLSWSATMFEYLMPPLFLKSYPGTLLADSAEGAVRHQIVYAKAKDVPWGISESGFYRFDANQNYQYHAFGVPGLGFKRGLSDDLVVAPYASLMAVRYNPAAVAQNLANLIKNNCFGLYGLYESIDFTSSRLLEGDTSTVVREYMIHHQGMIMMAMANFFHDDIMVKRMHRDPRIQSVELLLQEQVPQAAPLQDPYAEDGKGVRTASAAPIEIIPWSVPVHTPIPEVNLLSNGTYNVLISNMGGGYSSWRDVDLTRWQSDGVLDPWGMWAYIQELGIDQPNENKVWSAGHQPIPGDATEMQVTYFAHMAVFRRTENGIVSTLEVTVVPDDPLEIRRIHLHNNEERSRLLRLTSYGEVILAPQATDSRHPAFNKMFIESEFIPELNLQIFTRRPRSSKETPILIGHMLVVKNSEAVARHEADRYRFIGRGHTLQNPAALTTEQYLTGTSGATLDPIFALGQEIKLDAHDSADLAYLTFAAENHEAIIGLANRYRSWALIERSFHLANIASQTWLGKQDVSTEAFKDILQVLSALLYSFKLVRTSPETITSNRLGQPGLWRFGISGDYPILLVELNSPKQIGLVREVLKVHNFLHSRRFLIDVVILNLQQADYGAELHGLLYRLVNKMDAEEWLNQRGGIYILYVDQMETGERALLQTAARVLLKGTEGSLSNQMPGYSIPVHHLPEFTPTLPAESAGNPVPALQPSPLENIEGLKFNNGYGGFRADGREYIIVLPPGKATPAPWVNVIGYPGFGFMVSEAGSQCTWAYNSGENRLTPWSNDPVRDPTGEALYLRDEETGQIWTPTPLPAGADRPYRVTHGAGYTIFEHNSHDLNHRLTLFASPEDPVKIIHLNVKNTSARTRRITATQYIEWVLGISHAASMAYIIPEYDAGLECFLATNPYSAEFGTRVAFMLASKAVHGLTADRTEFLGRGGTPAFPAALHRLGLETRITPGEDPCAVLQLHLDLLPGASEEIYFVLGQGNDKEHALALAKKYHDPDFVSAAYQRTHTFWDHFLGALQVHTPEPAIDLILNRWALYQAISCRIWGRTGFYQSSGAFGFRDQLQDVLALLPIDPLVTRNQIINAAQHQFEEGDVLHWWHPPSGRGVRTRISDDLLWLPYVTSLYIDATGDKSLLEEKIPFLQAPPLKKGEEERYDHYPQTTEAFSLLEHCQRAIAKGATHGPHGLPLIGTGDWNDGLNRVGEGGKGESVWLGWFLIDVLKRFAVICSQNHDPVAASLYQSLASEYTAAIEKSAWDGAWYRRAFYDDGATLGSSQDAECQIDAIAQSWAILSGAGSADHTQQAMQSVLQRLIHPQDRLSLLFTPPFDASPRNPGYIKGYLPGIRENGGQYTHAATWTAWAFTRVGDGKQAGELFDLLNPIFFSDTLEKVAQYRVEPYVICADIYSQPPYLGRGGWTWYTGSAAWMYRLGTEGILGFRKVGNTLHIDPIIPPDWDGFDIRYQFGESVYLIQVNNPEHVAHHVRQILIDGQALEDGSIPLVDDKNQHHIVVTMGN